MDRLVRFSTPTKKKIARIAIMTSLLGIWWTTIFFRSFRVNMVVILNPIVTSNNLLTAMGCQLFQSETELDVTSAQTIIL
jgi:hypothetical protein